MPRALVEWKTSPLSILFHVHTYVAATFSLQRTYCVSITKSQVLSGEMNNVYCEKNTEHINRLHCAVKCTLLKDKPCGTISAVPCRDAAQRNKCAQTTALAVLSNCLNVRLKRTSVNAVFNYCCQHYSIVSAIPSGHFA